MIAKNLHNVVPLHKDVNQWYERRKTYHGGCFVPTLPTGYIAPTWLTVGESDVPEMAVTVTLPDELMSIRMTGVLDPFGDTSLTGGNHRLVISYDSVSKVWNILFDGEHLGKEESSASRTGLTETEARADSRTMYGQYGAYLIRGNLYCPTSSLTFTLYNQAGESAGTLSQTVVFDPLPDRHRTSRRYATLFMGGIDMQNAVEGVYYAQVVIGGQTYTTEPWRWKDDMENFIKVRYRRSRPILTLTNYITYTDNGESEYAELYLPGRLMKPPYNFEVEMDNRDGYNFVKKQVSYISDQVTVLCSAYFAEALRMLWHCNEREYEVDGEMVAVDYMESPEPNWIDRHLCEVNVVFRSDTVIQTNGEP